MEWRVYVGMKIASIGKCIGSDRRAQLYDGVCNDCLDSPHRGRKWALLANKIRKDPEFARIVYSQMKNVASRRLFMLMFRETLVKSGVDMTFMDALAEIKVASK